MLAVWPATVNVSATCSSVVLIEIPNVPENWTALPGTLNATVPESVPAMPAGVIRKKPVPLVSETPAVGVPRVRPTFVAAMRISFGGVEPAGACGLSVPMTCSKAKLPESCWPSTFSCVPFASTRR